MKTPAIGDLDVKAVFDRHDAATRKALKAVRDLIFEAAADTEGVGPLVETLKWGQPSYLPEKARVGTTVRLDKGPGDNGHVALFFHCQTNLLEMFRERYPDRFTYVGKRSIELDRDWQAHRDELRHCVGLALSYHRQKAGTKKR